ncbi:MAG: hypothetical protein [Caudoviricetes sp.]|nr:MAG: hypothetical protein [Caudoviricetes sp.]
MPTTPTNNPIPSESPRDLKFNAGKVDEIVNSPQEAYSDRFGTARLTWAGIEALTRASLSSLGYAIIRSFEDGATLTLPNQALLLESSGSYYRWDGAFPKVVPAGSTPLSTGGEGAGKWINVDEATLRSDLLSNSPGLGDNLIGVRYEYPGSKTRTQHEVNNDVISSNIWLTPNSTADQSSAFQSMISQAAGRKIILAAGIYRANFSITNSITIEGEGRDISIIKRPDNATQDHVVSVSGPVNCIIKGLTIDGNSSNNSVAAHNIFVSSDVENFTLDSARSSYAKSANGINIGNSNDTKNTNGIRLIKDSYFNNNGNDGIGVSRCYNVTIRGCKSYNNNSNGCSVSYYVFPPVAGSQQRILITENYFHNNSSAGCFILGFTEGGSASLPLYGVSSLANYKVIVSNNQILSNLGYGLAVQANHYTITGNICNDNGDYSSPIGSAFAGILVNGANGTVTGNIMQNNSGFGIDMGGSQYFTCNDNFVGYNCADVNGAGFIGMNFGACLYGTISGNQCVNNGPAAYGTQIAVPGYDGGGTSFQTNTLGLNITNNMMTLGEGSNRIGIRVYSNATSTSVTGNKTSGSNINRAINIETNQPCFVSGNSHDNIGVSVAMCTVNNFATLVIPDFADKIRVSGGGTISNIQTYSQSIFAGKIAEIVVTSQGSGYSQANPPVVTISGGGGGGATAAAQIDGGGKLISINMVTNGSGYTSAPTVTIDAPPAGGTQAFATSRLGISNKEGREWTIHFPTASTLTTGGNILIPGASSLSVPANGVVHILGDNLGNALISSKSF